jgi:hypothetical protein
MKILISESQYKKLIQEDEEEKIFRVPRINFFHKDPWEAWKILQKILERRGNPPYSIGGDLDLKRTPIKSLGNLQSVGGDLDLYGTPIESLGNLQSVGGYLDLEGAPIEFLGNLRSVGGSLNLTDTPIESLGNLISVDVDLDLYGTPLSNMYTEEEIRQMVNVGRKISH